MKPKQTALGIHCKTWVAILESEPIKNHRRMVCRCLACGALKIIRLDRLKAGSVKECSCGRTAPALLLNKNGASCRAPLRTPADCPSRENYKGYCCHYCQQEECESRCQNQPDKCGSFYYKK